MILSTWVYKVRWTCSMCFVVYVTVTIYCGVQTIHHIHVHQHLRDRFSRHRRSHSRTRARLHMGNPWTRVYVRLDPKRKPHHMTPTPTTWWGSAHYVISSHWWAVSCRGCGCCPQPRRLKQVSTLNARWWKRDRSSHRTRLCQHPPKSVGVRCAWVLCGFRTNTCRQPLLSPGV